MGKTSKTFTFAALKKLALALPGVEESTSYGTPAFKVCGKFLTRLHDEEPALVFKVSSIAERDRLLQQDPAVFYITEHYRNYAALLVRLATGRPAVIAQLLEDSWLREAPRRLLAEFTPKRTSGRR
jgi:hypothetical protein